MSLWVSSINWITTESETRPKFLKTGLETRTNLKYNADLVKTESFLFISSSFLQPILTFDPRYQQNISPSAPITAVAIVRLLYPISALRHSLLLLLRARFDQRRRVSRLHHTRSPHPNAIKHTSRTKPNEAMGYTHPSLHSTCQAGGRWGPIQCKEERNADMVVGDCLERCMRAAAAEVRLKAAGTKTPHLLLLSL